MQAEIDDTRKLANIISKSRKDFPYFLKHIFPYSFIGNDTKLAPHTFEWGQRIQSSKRTATLSARKHLKSTTMYAFIMWNILRQSKNKRISWLYMSYNQKMSAYHTENIKNHIQSNKFFDGIKDLTYGKTSINYTWGFGDKFQCMPSGILTFNRGWHGEGVVCDDILQDPTSELNFAIVEKINRVFMEQVMSLPIEGGQVHLVGTAQHARDLFFKLKETKGWNWSEYKAIVNEAKKEVLWPELFSFERLLYIREHEIGEKAFNKEYQCSPVWSEEAYFKRPELMSIVSVYNEKTREPALDIEKRPASEWKAGSIVAGFDIGKKSHPSHIAIFQLRNGHYKMLYHKFMRGWDYTAQVEFVNELVSFYLIDTIYYDATRGELESFAEQGILNPLYWKPVIFTVRSKFQMAGNFSKAVNLKNITLINNQMMIDSVLSVNNDLKAPETDIGHGDAFWSIGMALYTPQKSGGYMSSY